MLVLNYTQNKKESISKINFQLKKKTIEWYLTYFYEEINTKIILDVWCTKNALMVSMQQ